MAITDGLWIRAVNRTGDLMTTTTSDIHPPLRILSMTRGRSLSPGTGIMVATMVPAMVEVSASILRTSMGLGVTTGTTATGTIEGAAAKGTETTCQREDIPRRRRSSPLTRCSTLIMAVDLNGRRCLVAPFQMSSIASGEGR